MKTENKAFKKKITDLVHDTELLDKTKALEEEIKTAQSENEKLKSKISESIQLADELNALNAKHCSC